MYSEVEEIYVPAVQKVSLAREIWWIDFLKHNTF